jgi:dephospho-CoA kinase
MIVGLTGGIGSGKSTIAQLFKELGVPVYDSDKEAKLLMNTSATLRKSIETLLGKKAYRENTLNREYISNKVFKDDELLSKLNEIVHPEVKKHFKAWCVKQNSKYVVQESALIFENKSEGNYDKVILVTAPVSVRIARVISRDSVPESAVLQRIDNQLSDDEKLNLADYVIDNIDLAKTTESIKSIHDQLLSEAK